MTGLGATLRAQHLLNPQAQSIGATPELWSGEFRLESTCNTCCQSFNFAVPHRMGF
jgi:hypothetical protein